MSFWPQSLVDWAQIASAIGTCGAVIVSLMLANRGIQTKVEAVCSVKRSIGAPQLKVTLRNVGKDSVYLSEIGGVSASGAEQFHRFLNAEGHLTLAPGEPNTVTIERHMTMAGFDGDPIQRRWTRAWVRDISGKRFAVANSAECLAEIWSEMGKPLQPRSAQTTIPH